jgi:hypothetical protein
VVKTVSCVIYTLRVSCTNSNQALNKAWAENIHYQNIIDSAAGCVFLSVPHHGAALAYWAKNAATIMKALSGHGNNKLVRAISKSSDEWKKVDWHFAFRAANLSIATVFETQTMSGIMVSPCASSNSIIQMNHRSQR